MNCVNFSQSRKKKLLKKTQPLSQDGGGHYNDNLKKNCDLLNGKITIQICKTKEEVQQWKAYVHLTTSLPWKGAVGRQVKYFVKCDDVIIGMVHLTSPLAQCAVRDAYCNFYDKWENLKHIYNIETCVPTPNYSHLLTGKLLVYTVFSKEIQDYLETKYGDYVMGFETTSLYGKSSMYNRLPFFKYLGLTEGLSAVYISDNDWKKIWSEYKEVYPNTKTNRMAPVKFQIVDKMAKYYKKIGEKFPYEYQNVAFKRGVYFGYYVEDSLNHQINTWRNRWLIGRMERLNDNKSKARTAQSQKSHDLFSEQR